MNNNLINNHNMNQFNNNPNNFTQMVIKGNNLNNNNINNNINNFGNQQNSNNNLNYNQNSFNNINNNNFGKFNSQSSGVNRSINNYPQIKIIFDSGQKKPKELFFSPNTTIEDALNGYKNLFRNPGNYEFFFNEDKIDQYSKDLIGGKFYNNCYIQVIKK